MGTLMFNGKSSSDIGVVIQTPPVYEFPEKDYEIIHVEGKTGDVVINKNSYKNVGRTYYLASAFKEGTDFIFNAKSIIEWLMSAKGYARLEDSYEPEYYRMAVYRSEGKLTNMYDMATAIPVVFECKPQRFLKSGEIGINIDNKDLWIEINNPTKFISLPQITIEGTDLIIEIISGEDYDNPENQTQVNIGFSEEGIIDSEVQDCYNVSQYLNNNVVLSNGFPKLYPGINWIKITGTTLIKCSIKPNWWTL